MQQAWDIYLHGKLIDTVYATRGLSMDEVRDGLINHDGYDPAIIVQRG